jgi:hypothetical protein
VNIFYQPPEVIRRWLGLDDDDAAEPTPHIVPPIEIVHSGEPDEKAGRQDSRIPQGDDRGEGETG